MNFSLLDKILASESGFLATVLETVGHTYQKSGARALYTTDTITPVWGNLGSLCADQDIAAAGRDALGDGLPRRIRIDMNDKADAQLGYGTACGGAMSLLIEPVLESHRTIYREVVGLLESGADVQLIHDTNTGALSLGSGEPASREPEPNEAASREPHFVETIHPPARLVIFGATPLARSLCALVADMDYSICLIDWRPELFDALADLARVERAAEKPSLRPGDSVVIISHSFDHDREMVAEALEGECRYVGLLSSRKRRDLMFDALALDGFSTEQLSRVSSPIGLDIGARTDPEIAVSIVAELLRSAT